MAFHISKKVTFGRGGKSTRFFWAQSVISYVSKSQSCYYISKWNQLGFFIIFFLRKILQRYVQINSFIAWGRGIIFEYFFDKIIMKQKKKYLKFSFQLVFFFFFCIDLLVNNYSIQFQLNKIKIRVDILDYIFTIKKKLTCMGCGRPMSGWPNHVTWII